MKIGVLTVLAFSAVFCIFGGVAVLAQDLQTNSGPRKPWPGEAFARKDLIPRLERSIPQLMKEGEVQGLQIALVRAGERTWVRSFGVRNAEDGQPVKDDTVFEAASLSKPVFAYAVMKLVESGRLDLDRPLQSYLKEPYLAGDERVNAITARMVLDHTTGFQNEARPDQPLRINFTPGQKFSYSGAGFLFLQKVVEQIAGQPLDAFMHETVFRPLGMNSSSYVWQERYESRKANGHRRTGMSSPVRKPSVAWSYSTLHSTASDYAKFVSAMLEGRGLGEKTLAEMLRPQVRLDETCRNCIGRSPGRMSESLSWGLGWGLEQMPGALGFWHWGDNNNEFHAFVMGFPSANAGLVVFTNSGNGHSIIPEIVEVVTGRRHPAFPWMGYESYQSSSRLFYRAILARGDAAIAEYRASRKDRAAGDRLNEDETNSLGYLLLAKKRIPEAIGIFRINVEDYPASANAYDSLGEAYMIAGEKDLAVKNLRRSLELDPKNSHAVDLLMQLGEKP